MKYRALYRKYRPKNFDEISGQNVTLKILKNSIAMKKTSHAYLFFGPRGTGKTSIAKIFARAVNCINPQDSIQCEICKNCLISKEKECIDIIEIDAASNNGVDEIRDLKSKVAFVPSELTYKVYIIDEVHMLSPGAFNALLKTLEEPPSHAIFILATTELQKVPITIISRCQTLEFKKISNVDIEKRIKEISDSEKIMIDNNAIEEIAKYSKGGLRDAIGILEKANSFCEGNITRDIIRMVSGNIPKEEFDELIKSFNANDIENIIKKIDEYYIQGYDLMKMANELMEYMCNQMINERTFDGKRKKIVDELNELLNNLKNSDNQKLLFEIAALSICISKDELENKSLSKEQIIDKQKDVIRNNNDEESEPNVMTKEEIKNARISNTMCDPQKELISKIRNDWSKLKDLAFDESYGNLARLLSSDILPVAASKTNVILISKLKGLSEQINIDLYNVEKIFEIVFEKKYKPICISEKEWSNYIELYKKDKTYFKYIEEKELKCKREMTLKDKAKELFEDI